MSFFCWKALCFVHSLARASSLSVAVEVIISKTAIFAWRYSGVPSSPTNGFHFGTSAAPMNFSRSISWSSRHVKTHDASLRGGSARRPRKKEMPRCRSMHFKRKRRMDLQMGPRRASVVWRSWSTLGRHAVCSARSMGSLQSTCEYLKRIHLTLPTSRSILAGDVWQVVRLKTSLSDIEGHSLGFLATFWRLPLAASSQSTA
mmetsp:Transcript_28467/g.60372  ORF Transcript_28467/g.60372 Transcript_28467/m.60372 type:complete len:202 (+) Transcript_28467:2715-3320(+)